MDEEVDSILVVHPALASVTPSSNGEREIFGYFSSETKSGGGTIEDSSQVKTKTSANVAYLLIYGDADGKEPIYFL